MNDKLLIARKIKKLIEYMEKMTEYYPRKEYHLKNKILDSSYRLLEYTYCCNNGSVKMKEEYQTKIMGMIPMIDYYIKISCDKKIISFKKYEVVGKMLLEINLMMKKWSGYEKCK